MSELVFDGTAHTVTLHDAQNHQVGQWHANNVVDHQATLRFVPNRVYQVLDSVHPHRHGGSVDTLNGSFGRFGIIRLQEFQAEGRPHQGVGIHSGRANQGGADFVTTGCIRTTDAAMAAITQHMRNDPLRSITVRDNHDQHNRHPRLRGDHHHHGHRHQPSHHGRPGQTPGI